MNPATSRAQRRAALLQRPCHNQHLLPLTPLSPTPEGLTPAPAPGSPPAGLSRRLPCPCPAPNQVTRPCPKAMSSKGPFCSNSVFLRLPLLPRSLGSQEEGLCTFHLCTCGVHRKHPLNTEEVNKGLKCIKPASALLWPHGSSQGRLSHQTETCAGAWNPLLLLLGPPGSQLPGHLFPGSQGWPRGPEGHGGAPGRGTGEGAQESPWLSFPSRRVIS